MTKRRFAKRLAVASILAASLAAPATLAQQSAPPTTHQMKDNTQTQERVASGDRNIAHRQEGYYHSLDRGNKGYLDNDDVSGDPFLSQNFAKCDMDHDGKMMLSEFLECTHANPSPNQQ